MWNLGNKKWARFLLHLNLTIESSPCVWYDLCDVIEEICCILQWVLLLACQTSLNSCMPWNFFKFYPIHHMLLLHLILFSVLFFSSPFGGGSYKYVYLCTHFFISPPKLSYSSKHTHTHTHTHTLSSMCITMGSASGMADVPRPQQKAKRLPPKRGEVIRKAVRSIATKDCAQEATPATHRRAAAPRHPAASTHLMTD